MVNRGIRYRAWIGLLCLAMVLSACNTAAEVQRIKEPNGTLRWSLEGITTMQRLDPARMADYPTIITVNLIFGGLVRLNENLEIVGDGAESWTVSADGRVYTFRLREDLAYGDGTAVTAQDFADSLYRTLAPASGSAFAYDFLRHVVGAEAASRGEATSISGVKALDAQTLEITLDTPRAYFLSQLTYGLFSVVPPGKIEAAGEQWVSQAYGTGPFRVKEFVPGQKLLLEGNPHYWDGLPGIEQVELRFFPDSATALDAYLAGELDIMGSIQGGVPIDRLDEVDALKDAHTVSAPAVRYVGFNTQRPPFDNIYIRQAFAQSVDKGALANDVLAGRVLPTDRILPPGFPAANLAIEGLSFDPLGARSALGLAGYVSGNSLPAITLTYGSDTDTDRVAKALQQNWRDTLGVNVILEGLPTDEFVERLNATTADPTDTTAGVQMYMSIWGADYADPQNFLSLQLHSDTAYNNGHWFNSEFDRITSEADQLSGQGQVAERMRLYNQAEQIAIREVGWLPLFTPEVTILINPKVEGLSITAAPQGIIAADWNDVSFD